MILSNLLPRLMQRWRSVFHVYSALDRDSAEVRARHIGTVVRLTPVSVLANLANSALVVSAFHASVSRAAAAAWIAAMLVLCGWALKGWHAARRQPVRSASPRAVRRVVVGAVALSLWWGSLVLAWFPQAEPGRQLLLAIVVVGMMCGGAFILAPVAGAAMAYIAVLGVASIGALAWAPGEQMIQLQGLLLVYAVALAFSAVGAAQVFTARLLSEREAARQGQLVGLLLRDFEEHSADVLWEIGPTGCLTHISPRLSAALHASPAELQALSLFEALRRCGRAPDDEGHLDALRAALTLGQAFRDLVVPVRAGRRLRWWSLSGKPLLDEAGHHAGWRGVITDVTQARETHRRLAYLAHFDSLTGLANRLELRERLARTMSPDNGPVVASVALMCLDVDHFKTINDTLGHAAGDAVLVEVGRRLQSCLRQTDLAARLGGDEFALMITDVGSYDELTALAWRIVKVLCEPCDIDGRQVTMGISMGVAVAPEHGRTLDELMANADLALYAAKEAGRGRFEFFAPRLGDRHRRRVAIEQALRGALARGEMHLCWQPRVELDSWQVQGAEVLLRWQHPELGRVAPEEFIRVAEDSGQIAEIGTWALNQACAQAARMPGFLLVSVNVSPMQLMRTDFEATVRRALESSRLEPQRLEIEVTESLFLEPSPQALANLHALRAMGVRIALDDFGTGYSSLAYLRRFPFDTLKIDRAFVRELMTRHDARAIVKTILELARTLGMSTIAEGVEEPAQLQVLREAGCEAIQGFMVARPMLREQFLRLLANWTAPDTVFVEPPQWDEVSGGWSVRMPLRG